MIPKIGQLVNNAKDEISFIEGEGNYSWIYLANGKKVLTSYTLLKWEKQLTDPNFCRVHKSYLVNLCHVKSHVRRDLYIKVGGYEVPISRRRKLTVLQSLSTL